ncbi:unnamed protein product [Diamesa hyperborea]
MAFKFIALFAVLAVASAQYHNDYYQPQQEYKQVQPIYQAPTVVKQIVAQPTLVKKVEYEEPANYEFNYSVHDEHTGDIKQQQEVAKDGVISGQYSLIDADGYRRIVDYTADDHHGFNAQVRREPVEGYKAPIQKIIAQPQYYSAPAPAVQKIIAQPQYHSAPSVNYAAPAPQYYSAPAPASVKYVAPVVAKVVTPVVAKYESAPIAQFGHSGPSSNYHY